MAIGVTPVLCDCMREVPFLTPEVPKRLQNRPQVRRRFLSSERAMKLV
jgi:hypothetical protein